MRNAKGQGALEYLLLIGGAVLVAAIVIVLLLGINSQSNTTTQQNSLTTLCLNQAGTANPLAPKCTDVGHFKTDGTAKAPENYNRLLFDTSKNKCYACGNNPAGATNTYPNCVGIDITDIGPTGAPAVGTNDTLVECGT